ncbi:alpha/beta hydrolase [Weissella muntiaci]|uniref:Alpha/beta hydrolase n=1 Tax=Weissella muntiaci TaxID=2508881 RepID=A0A6C2C798_9LACO|nr:alpha/beta hydrolase [Weissella muntiaci]TYC49808.1 alpha/beta hydrolase [Weissella muntiaci]
MKKNVLLVILILGLVAIAFVKLSKPASTGVIDPTLYVTGSSGKIESIQAMVDGAIKANSVGARPGLSIVVMNNGSLMVDGTISRNNHYPTIAIGMETGTESSKKYLPALTRVMAYLQKHYHVGYVNILGYSSGGSGVLRYLVAYSDDSKYPRVNKFLSLDGQYNGSVQQDGQSYLDAIQHGPAKQSKYYQYWQKNYRKIDSRIQVDFLASNFDPAKETDGVVPWADTFAPINLLVKNSNPVQYHIFKGTPLEHGAVAQNQEAINYVKEFFYGQ